LTGRTVKRLPLRARVTLGFECGLLFFVLPPMLYLVRHQMAFRVFFVLAIAAMVCVFGWRYHKSRSLPLVSLEHALWGDYLFTISIGWFFYSGAIQ